MPLNKRTQAYIASCVGVNLRQSDWVKIEELARISTLRGIFHYLSVYVAILSIVFSSIYLDHVAATIVAIILIGGRQHSLYILNHDAAHYRLFKTPRVNKLVASILSNFVMLHHPSAWSYVQWTRVHRFHHAKLFTQDDPNYYDRLLNKDTQKFPTTFEVIVASFKNGLSSITRLIFSRQEYVPPKGNSCELGKYNHLRTILLPFRDDNEMEVERIQKLIFFSFLSFVLYYFGVFWEFFIYWIIPMYLVFPVILAFMDQVEHRWALSSNHSNNVNNNSRSIHFGFIAKIFLSFLPRGLHREHHIYPRAVASQLPALSRILCDKTQLSKPLKGMPELIKEINALAKSDKRRDQNAF